MEDPISPALRAVSDAVLSVAVELSVDEVLQRLVDSARELVGARCAALGIPDGAGGFRSFLVSGMSDALIAQLGPLPRTHGMLGAMLETRPAPCGPISPPTSMRTPGSRAAGRAPTQTCGRSSACRSSPGGR